jgi:Calcium binding
MDIKLKLGDSVVVKQGTKEPDLEEFEIGAWQGRVVEIDTKSNLNNTLVTIEWDALTLKQIPSYYIEQSERDGYDWKMMALFDSELEKTKPRDTKEKVKQVQGKISDKYYWFSYGDEGIRISKVLGNVNPRNEMKCLQKWVDYLDKELTFPIDAIVSESGENYLIQTDDKVTIKSLPHIVDLYGIIASVKLGRGKYEFPLCDLEIIDKTNAAFQLVEDYRTWHANR